MEISDIRAWWIRLCHKGVATGMDPRIVKRIVLCNQFAFAFGGIALPFCLVHLFSGRHSTAGVAFFVTLSYLIIPWLNRPAWPSLSRLLLVGVGNIGILLQCFNMGMDSDMHYYFCTSAWLGLILFAPQERLSLGFSIAIPMILLSAFIVFDQAVGGWQPLPAEETRQIAFYNLISYLPVQLVGVIYFYLANYRTENALSKAWEEAKAADRSKSRFLANMSHELRTPLNGILGLSGLVLREDLKPRHREILLGVHSSAHDLLALVNDLLDISRIEAGKMRLDAAPFRLRALAEIVLAPFRFEAERKALDLHLEIDPDVPDALSGDAIRLKQVLNNLLGNAFKFTETGGVALRIRKSPVAAGAEAARLHFEVEDTGIGIPDSAHGEVFKPFSQADTSAARRHEGAGLGLYISRQIVESLGGDIGFSSRTDRGSTFHFIVELPLAESTPGPEAAEAAVAGEVAPEPGPPPSTSASRVLIVEDHALNRKVISGMLGARGIQADEASGGAEALEALDRFPYRMIFTDLHMPGMDGFEFTRRVRAGTRSPAPVIVGVTADAMAETRSRCLQSGMDDVITKPILARDLEAVLARLDARSLDRSPSAPTVSPALPNGDVSPSARGDASASAKGDRTAYLVDMRHVSELDEWVRTHDRGFWDRAAAQFRADAARLAGAVREAVAEGRRLEAGDAAHTLKGVALMLGFDRIGKLSLELEDAIREDRGAAWAGKLKEIEETVDPSVEELRTKVSPPASEPAGRA